MEALAEMRSERLDCDVEEDEIEEDGRVKLEQIDAHAASTAAALSLTGASQPSLPADADGGMSRARLRTIVARATAMRPDLSVPLSSLFRLPLVEALTPAAMRSSTCLIAPRPIQLASALVMPASVSA